MKKSLLLLAFVVNAALAFAMTGPVKMVEPQKLLADKEATVETGCMVCANCDGLMICVFGVNCGKATDALGALMVQLKCGEDG